MLNPSLKFHTCFFIDYLLGLSFGSQVNENNSKVGAAGKLVGEINPDNFTYESRGDAAM